MKSSSGSKGDRKDLLTAEDITRRKFLKAGVGFAAVASGLEMIAGCATTETPKEHVMASPPTGKAEPVIYSQLSYNKIQPPREGCLVGLFKPSALMKSPIYWEKMKEVVTEAKSMDEFVEMFKKEGWHKGLEQSVSDNITYYEKALGAKPSIFVLLDKLYSGFPTTQSIEVAKRGIVVYVHACLGSYYSLTPSFDLKEIVQGKYNNYIKEFARGAGEFGKDHGSFFFTTMEEGNGNWYDWGKNSNFIGAWRHIWQIFEDQGANQYVTWVWEGFSPEGVPSAMVDHPELYYPGDKYVDWIGINKFSVAGIRSIDSSLYTLIQEIYKQTLENHPQKPIMLSEFARTNGYDQPKWLTNAYGKIKSDFPAIKAAIYMDNTWTLTGDHTLSSKGLQTLKEIFKDSYWIIAK
jgi:hypothetical protein